MRTAKKYTNQTFTKRVDHEAGSHRPTKAIAEPAICGICRDVYADRRWSKPDASGQSEKHPHFRNATTVVCPACKRIEDKIPSGYVYLSGAFLAQHFEDISRLLHNEAERASIP